MTITPTAYLLMLIREYGEAMRQGGQGDQTAAERAMASYARIEQDIDTLILRARASDGYYIVLCKVCGGTDEAWSADAPDIDEILEEWKQQGRPAIYTAIAPRLSCSCKRDDE